MRVRTVAIVLAALVLAGCGKPDPDPVAGGMPYRDLEAKFALTVPDGWQATHGFGDVRLMLTRREGGQSVRISVLWDREQGGGVPSLDDYVKFRVPRIAHFAKDRELLHQERAALNDQVAAAERIDYRYVVGPGTQVRSRTWLTATPNGGYALTLTAGPETFDDLEPVWQRAQGSFRTLP